MLLIKTRAKPHPDGPLGSYTDYLYLYLTCDFLSFISERTSQLKSWTTRELQDIEGFSAQNVSQLILPIHEISFEYNADLEMFLKQDCLLDFSESDIILISKQSKIAYFNSLYSVFHVSSKKTT